MTSVISPVSGVRAMLQWPWGHHPIWLWSLVGWHHPWRLSQEWVSGSGWTQEPRQRAWHARMLNYFSHVWVFMTLWTIAHQAPLSMGFFRQEYWSGLPFSSPKDLPSPGIKPRSPTLQVDFLPFELPGKPHLTLFILFILFICNHKLYG